MRSGGTSPPSTSCALWRKPMPPPRPVRSAPCCDARGCTPRIWSGGGGERQVGILKALTPRKRGPKSKRHPLVEENQKLRGENQRLTEELRKAEIVIDVQKKMAELLGILTATAEAKP